MTAAPKTPGRAQRPPRALDALPGLDVAGGLVQGKPSPPAAKHVFAADAGPYCRRCQLPRGNWRHL